MTIGEALVKQGLITREHLKLALERQVVFGGRIGTNIVELGILQEEELAVFLSNHLKVPVAKPHELMSIDSEVTASLNPKIAEKYKVIPFRKDKNRLHVAMLDPKNIQGIEELRFVTGYDIIPYLATELRLLYALERFYGFKRDLRFVSVLDQMREDETEGAEEKAPEAPQGDDSRLKKVKEAFAAVKTREEVAAILLAESKKVAKRAALFLVKNQEVAGWVSKDVDIKDFSLAADTSNIFADVLMRRLYYRGPLLKIPGNAKFIETLGGAPEDCILLPVTIRDRVICLLYADNGNKKVLNANIAYANKLVNLATLAFELLILKKKIMDV